MRKEYSHIRRLLIYSNEIINSSNFYLKPRVAPSLSHYLKLSCTNWLLWSDHWSWVSFSLYFCKKGFSKLDWYTSIWRYLHLCTLFKYSVFIISSLQALNWLLIPECFTRSIPLPFFFLLSSSWVRALKYLLYHLSWRWWIFFLLLLPRLRFTMSGLFRTDLCVRGSVNVLVAGEGRSEEEKVRDRYAHVLTMWRVN